MNLEFAAIHYRAIRDRARTTEPDIDEQTLADNVRTREVNGRELSYLEGWYAISEADRFFGFGAWNRETAVSKCVLAKETRGAFLAVYTARVRITVQADG